MLNALILAQTNVGIHIFLKRENKCVHSKMLFKKEENKSPRKREVFQ